VITLLETPRPETFGAILADLDLAPGAVSVEDLRYAAAIKAPTLDRQLAARRAAGGGSVLLSTQGLGSGIPRTTTAIRARLRSRLSEEGHFLLVLPGSPSDAELCRWRNHLWPDLHATALYRCGSGGIRRTTPDGAAAVPGPSPCPCAVYVFRRREKVMAPDQTALKFDLHAAAWNGSPGRAGYAHYRWMRRLVGRFAGDRPCARILDFGSGTGWVGIEAALVAPRAELAAFDPSPEMVRLAEANARLSGIERFAGAVGFGDEPPFPRAGEPAYDLVLSSGVLSFALDVDRWLDGLSRTVAAGGALVLGDLNPESIGMLRRRAKAPLLPVREMNARGAAEVQAALERRGFAHRALAYYQLTTPVPEAAAWCGRAFGRWLDAPFLWLNAASTALQRSAGLPRPGCFDSWVMRFERAR
jgi:SAM-dependent methyltransferase